MLVGSASRRLSVGVILFGSLFLTRSAKATEQEGPACGLSCSAGGGTNACSANVNDPKYNGTCTEVCCDAPSTTEPAICFCRTRA